MTAPPPISLQRQASAVAREACNLAGHLDNIRAKTGRQARTPEEIAMTEQRVAELTAAAHTMEWVADHEGQVRRLGLGNGEEAA